MRRHRDASLRFSATERRGLIRALRRRGLASSRRNIARRVGCFVAEKNGDIRLAIEGREPNAFHQRSPRVDLVSAGAPSFLELSDEFLTSDGVDPSSVDLSI
eukprot:9490036-Pyramimonas_sp.AAC.1